MTSCAPVELHAGPYSCSVDVTGASLRTLTFDDHPLVVGDQPAAGAVLAPWPNRTEDGCFTWQGRHYQLELTEPERTNAIHGLLKDRPWSLQAQGETWCQLVVEGAAPWEVRWEIHYRLSPADGLRVQLRADNTGQQSWPLGMGFHPYLTAWGASPEETFFSLDVAEHIELSQDRLLPTGRRTQVEGFRGVRLADCDVDDCFRMRPGGEYRAQLVNSAGHGVELTSEHPYFQIYSGGVGLAVEPQTCPPNMLRSTEGLKVLSPGETMVGGYGIRAIVS